MKPLSHTDLSLVSGGASDPAAEAQANLVKICAFNKMNDYNHNSAIHPLETLKAFKEGRPNQYDADRIEQLGKALIDCKNHPPKSGG
jgi:hypothetical protein